MFEAIEQSTVQSLNGAILLYWVESYTFESNIYISQPRPYMSLPAGLFVFMTHFVFGISFSRINHVVARGLNNALLVDFILGITAGLSVQGGRPPFRPLTVSMVMVRLLEIIMYLVAEFVIEFFPIVVV